MRRERLPLALTCQVAPAALGAYVRGLGWHPLENVRNGAIAVYQQPGSPERQVIVPVDEGLDDYGEAVAEAVNRLADVEQRSPRELLDQLLLPPADLLRFDPVGAQPSRPTLPLDSSLDLLRGVRQALMAVAHSVLQPLPSHSRLDRPEAERLVAACQVGRAHGPGLALLLACPLDAVLTEGSLLKHRPPFVRQVTAGLMQVLSRLVEAASQQRGEELLLPGAVPLLSANLCQALLLLRPPDDRASLTVTAVWSRQVPPGEPALPGSVTLSREAFTLADCLAPRLRTADRPERSWYVGFVEGLRGQPGEDGRPAGEVQVIIVQDDGLLHARLVLSAGEYALAIAAHMGNHPLSFQGLLIRSPGEYRVEQVAHIQVMQRQPLAQAS